MEFTSQLPTQGIGLSEMITAMAAQQQVYTVPAYGGLEAYAQYPQYVAQVSHGAYIASATAPQQVLGRSARESFEAISHGYEESSRHRERREYRDRDRERDRKERDRERDYRDRRDRERDRDRRDRDRDRDRDKERDRDRDRDRERERDRDRERERYREEERERSPRSRDRDHRDRDYDRDSRDSAYDDDFRAPDYKAMPPNNTIMVRGLAQHITENDIRADILACNLMPKDIRLVRKKESGASRGFAFVEFTTVHDATRWMEAKQGVLILQDVYRATLQYSIPKEASDRQSKQSQDWFCIRCGAHNFKRRDSCFKCSSPRHESEAGEEGSDEICNYPTNLLLLRGLDVLSTEESVLQSIEHASSDLPIRSVRIGRDPLTNTSRGVCYVELNSVLDSMQLFNKLASSPPVIDGKQATIAYCKLSQGGSQASGTQQQQTHQPIEYTAGADIKKLAEYSASVYAQTPEEHAAYVQYYTMYYQQQAQAASSGTQSDSVNAAAAVAQSALQAMQQKASVGTVVAAAVASSQVTYSASSPTAASAVVTTAASTVDTTTSVTTSYDMSQLQEGEYPKYPTPDVSTYKYDETSGYYYDPSTGLYYDANSTYYYNAETGQYLYWDAEKSTYLPAPTSEETLEGLDGKPRDKKEKDKDKQDKVKVAKKIAKDMERWAKAQNKRNESSSKNPNPEPAGGSVGEGPIGSGAADAAFAVLLERRDRPTLDKHTFQMHMKKDVPPVLSGLKKSGLVAAYGGEGSDSDEEKDGPIESDRSEEKLVDVVKMACLLCKRQFPNKDALTKHVQLSNLHKSNLEALSKGRGDMVGSTQQYRDRAKERREKYGQPNIPPPNKLKKPTPPPWKNVKESGSPFLPQERYMAAREEVQASSFDEPSAKDGGGVLGNDSIGNRLMKKMGWTDGMGLGKSNQGRTNIIEAERRVATAGLGLQGSTYSVAGDSYKDCVKKMMFHRYQELDALEKANGKS